MIFHGERSGMIFGFFCGIFIFLSLCYLPKIALNGSYKKGAVKTGVGWKSDNLLAVYSSQLCNQSLIGSRFSSASHGGIGAGTTHIMSERKRKDGEIHSCMFGCLFIRTLTRIILIFRILFAWGSSRSNGFLFFCVWINKSGFPWKESSVL